MPKFTFILLVLLPVTFAHSSFAQSTLARPELSAWIASNPLTEYTPEDTEALKAIYTVVHEDLVAKIEAEVSSTGQSSGKYLTEDAAAVALMFYARAIVVGAEISSEDLWFTFLLVKMRRLVQQKTGGYTAHATQADAAAFKKLREIMVELEKRSLHLPGVNMRNTMNISRN